MSEKYSVLVEADAILTFKADDEEHAEELGENLNTGVLGPGKVRAVERFDMEDD